MKKKFLAAISLCLLSVSQFSYAQAVTFKATISWTDNSNNEDGFKIERSNALNGTFTEIASVGAGVVSYVDQPVAPGATVCYRILAFNVAGKSAPSTVACATAPSVPASPSTTQIVITVAP